MRGATGSKIGASRKSTAPAGKGSAASRKVVFGDPEAITAQLHTSLTSTTINTSFVERENFTLRQSNRRLTRKTSG